MDNLSTFNIEETVLFEDRGKTKLGIVEGIRITEEQRINNRGIIKERSVIYDVRSHYRNVYSFNERCLSPSKKKLHREAFRARPGLVLILEGAEYVVENARYESTGIQGAWPDAEDVERIWTITARKLADGKYDPHGKEVTIRQKSDEPLDVLREMTLSLDFK